jgi:hypothetical protein
VKLAAETAAELVGLIARRSGRARLTISGTSMEPLLRAGMVIDVEPLVEDPCIGDILVFLAQGALVAHRLVGGELFAHDSGIAGARLLRGNSASYRTAGDAFPEREEIVPAGKVIGRVVAVWAGPAPDAQRIDGALFRGRGRLYARTRHLRAAWGRLRRYAARLRRCAARLRRWVGLRRDPRIRQDPSAGRAVPAFRTLRAATKAFESGDFASGVGALRALDLDTLLSLARRHHASGLISLWLEEALRAGVSVPRALQEPFRRARYLNALQTGRVLRCVGDVRDRFTAAGVPHIFLKGGARLGAGEAHADRQFSADVDVLVAAGDCATALAALRDAGYADMRPEGERAAYAQRHHHREPLCSPSSNVPVEVHTELAIPAMVSERLDFCALAGSSHDVAGPVGVVRVLDDDMAALHLAYHARDLRVWRDVVLLSRKLRALDSAARARFDARVCAETLDGLRLASAVAAADELAFNRRPAMRVRRYLAWVDMREDLPRRLGDGEVIEMFVGACRVPKLQLNGRHDFPRWVRAWLSCLGAVPAVLRSAFGSDRKIG